MLRSLIAGVLHTLITAVWRALVWVKRQVWRWSTLIFVVSMGSMSFGLRQSGMPFVTLGVLAATFRRGLERREPLPDLLRYLPGLFALAATVLAFGNDWSVAHRGQWWIANIWIAKNILYSAPIAAMWYAGARVGGFTLTWRDWRDEIVLGPTGWAFLASFAYAALAVAPAGAIAWTALAITAWCGLIARYDEPLWITTDKLLVQAMQRRNIKLRRPLPDIPAFPRHTSITSSLP